MIIFFIYFEWRHILQCFKNCSERFCGGSGNPQKIDILNEDEGQGVFEVGSQLYDGNENSYRDSQIDFAEEKVGGAQKRPRRENLDAGFDDV